MLYVAGAIAILLVTSLVVARWRMPVGPVLTSDREIAQAAGEGRWHLAVKSYRALHGVGLKQAKEAVNALVASSTSTSSDIEANRR
jgi:hypothetical protein